MNLKSKHPSSEDCVYLRKEHAILIYLNLTLQLILAQKNKNLNWKLSQTSYSHEVINQQPSTHAPTDSLSPQISLSTYKVPRRSISCLEWLREQNRQNPCPYEAAIIVGMERGVGGTERGAARLLPVSLRGYSEAASAGVNNTAKWIQLLLQEGTATAGVKICSWRDVHRNRKQTGRSKSLPPPPSLQSPSGIVYAESNGDQLAKQKCSLQSPSTSTAKNIGRWVGAKIACHWHNNKKIIKVRRW